jgi:hypothetical protein
VSFRTDFFIAFYYFLCDTQSMATARLHLQGPDGLRVCNKKTPGDVQDTPENRLRYRHELCRKCLEGGYHIVMHVERPDNPNWTWCRLKSYDVKSLPQDIVDIWAENTCKNCRKALEAYNPLPEGIQLPENIRIGGMSKRGMERLKKMHG